MRGDAKGVLWDRHSSRTWRAQNAHLQRKDRCGLQRKSPTVELCSLAADVLERSDP